MPEIGRWDLTGRLRVNTGWIRVLHILSLSFLCANCDFMMDNREKYTLF
jgi:hypothetical protein